MRGAVIMRAAVLALAAFVWCAPALASGAGEARAVPGVVKELQGKYETVESLSADFTQETYSRATDSTTTSSGRVYFKKPGMMRWEYDEPAGDLLVSDGETLWVYQADLNQVVRRPADKASSNVATDFLSGVGNLTRDFSVEVKEEVPGEAVVLDLAPRSPLGNVERIELVVDPSGLLIREITTFDYFGNETTVAFTGVETGNGPAPGFFEFTPPEGAVVVTP